MIDYKQDVGADLAHVYGNHKFDLIIDTLGMQSLYTQSPAYLAHDKLYICLGALSVSRGSHFFWNMAKFLRTLAVNYYWPQKLWGTPRQYMFMSAYPDELKMGRVRDLVEKGVLKAVVDSVWDLKDIVKVRSWLRQANVGVCKRGVWSDEGEGCYSYC